MKKSELKKRLKNQRRIINKLENGTVHLLEGKKDLIEKIKYKDEEIKSISRITEIDFKQIEVLDIASEQYQRILKEAQREIDRLEIIIANYETKLNITKR